jgi:hypothetical protein
MIETKSSRALGVALALFACACGDSGTGGSGGSGGTPSTGGSGAGVIGGNGAGPGDGGNGAGPITGGFGGDGGQPPEGGTGGTPPMGGEGGTGGTPPVGGEGGAGGTGGVGVGGEGGGGGAPPAVVLTNNDATCGVGGIEPLPEEYGHRAAGRLTPPSYPFEVNTVRYRMIDNMMPTGCIDLAHDVFVFAATGTTPPAAPVPHETITVPTGSIVGGWVELSLTTPLVLQTGESLFIAVEMQGLGDNEYMCLGTCSGPGFDTGRNFWSNAASAPYPWVTLESFGFLRNYQMEAE